MRLSCCAYSYRQMLQRNELSLPDFLGLCRQTGCEGAELTNYYFPTTERAYLNALKRRAHEEGVLISGTAARSEFTHPDAAKRAADVAHVKEWLGHSVVLGAPTLRVFAGRVHPGQSEDEAFANVVACLQECGVEAEKQGVLVALENHGGVTATAAQTLRLWSAVGSAWVGLNLDFGNFGGDDLYDQFAGCAPHAVATHAKRNDKDGAPIDYTRVCALLAAANYQGWLAIEYEEKEPAEEVVPRFATDLRSVLEGAAL